MNSLEVLWKPNASRTNRQHWVRRKQPALYPTMTSVWLHGWANCCNSSQNQFGRFSYFFKRNFEKPKHSSTQRWRSFPFLFCLLHCSSIDMPLEMKVDIIFVLPGRTSDVRVNWNHGKARLPSQRAKEICIRRYQRLQRLRVRAKASPRRVHRVLLLRSRLRNLLFLSVTFLAEAHRVLLLRNRLRRLLHVPPVLLSRV